MEYPKVLIVNKSGDVLGSENKLKAHKHPLVLHKAISVIIFSPDKRQMLIQKRSTKKKTWPLFWTNICCSHPLDGESERHAAERRLKEEMGFSTPLSEKFKFIYKAKYDKTWGEHEFDHVFVGYYSGSINPDPDEAADYKWIKTDELKKDVRENPGVYTPWFKKILEKIL